MKKLYVFIFVAAFAVAGVKAQQPEFRWELGLGGPSVAAGAGDETAVEFVPDGSGNIYVIGDFTGTVDFDPGPGVQNMTAAGDSDIFIAKYSVSGNLMWNFRIGGSGLDEGLGIFLHNDLLYLTGY